MCFQMAIDSIFKVGFLVHGYLEAQRSLVHGLTMRPSCRTVKLADFGMAHKTRADTPGEKNQGTQDTEVLECSSSGSVSSPVQSSCGGTPLYAAPEVADGLGWFLASDLYSLGVVAVEVRCRNLTCLNIHFSMCPLTCPSHRALLVAAGARQLHHSDGTCHRRGKARRFSCCGNVSRWATEIKACRGVDYASSET